MRTLGKITKRQNEAIKFIRNFSSKQGHSPTFKEIGNHMNITPACAYMMLVSMRRKGAVDWEDGKMRTIRIVEVA